MHIDGGCHCGHITFEAQVDPEAVRICHCTDCQMLTGTAFRVTVPALEGTFRLLSGHPKTYVKTADSGNKRTHAFCPECGAPICSMAPGDSRHVGLRLGTIRQRAQLQPRKQGWCQSALGWVMNLDSLPKSPRQPS